MKLTLNPFALVIKMNDTYNFILSDFLNPVNIIPTERQKQILEKMNCGEFYDYEKLCNVFGDEVVNSLVEKGCFIQGKVDTKSIYSRTNAFFATHNMPDARRKLSEKKVIILGCGGIGTHMAWHMCALGVNKITLVDFDRVEISNLNRQLLFEEKDEGKIKTDVLKEKLEAINSQITVETVNAKISSEEELEKILLSDRYDLIIKALDSPEKFPLWLDNVVKRHNLTYIAGITMGANVLIGPSYILGKSNYGWSDLMGTDIVAEKMYGTASSLGIMLYYISNELAVEAFKILTGYGKTKYTDKILCKNLITDEENVIQKNPEKVSAPEEKSKKALILNVFLMISLVIGAWSGRLVFALVAAMMLPFFLYKERQNVMRCTFINIAVFSVGLLIRCLENFSFSSPTEIVSSFVMLFGLHSAVTLFACLINYFVFRIFFNFHYLKKR